MSKLTAAEASDLFACIELGWAKPVPAASHKNEVCEFTFYRVEDQVFYIDYQFSSTISFCYEVTGEDLEMFNIHYGKEAVA